MCIGVAAGSQPLRAGEHGGMSRNGGHCCSADWDWLRMQGGGDEGLFQIQGSQGGQPGAAQREGHVPVQPPELGGLHGGPVCHGGALAVHEQVLLLPALLLRVLQASVLRLLPPAMLIMSLTVMHCC